MNPAAARVVLIVDDDATDILFTEHAVAASGAPVAVQSALGAENALNCLRGFLSRGEPLPVLVLLDIKMPGMDGFEFLEAVRADPSLHQLRAVMHSSSDDPGDIRRARELGAADYLRKYPTPAQLASLLSSAQG